MTHPFPSLEPYRHKSCIAEPRGEPLMNVPLQQDAVWWNPPSGTRQKFFCPSYSGEIARYNEKFAVERGETGFACFETLYVFDMWFLQQKEARTRICSKFCSSDIRLEKLLCRSTNCWSTTIWNVCGVPMLLHTCVRAMIFQFLPDPPRVVYPYWFHS